MCRPALIALGCLLLTSQAQAKLKVFILAGQSNMQGAGAIKINPKSKNGGQGTLEYLVKDERLAKRLAHVVDASGDWVVRDDVWIKYFDRKGGLTVGYGAKRDRIGPEFQFGHALGQALDEQVLLIKTAWGGRCLATDFRPPRSGGRHHLKSGSPGAYYTLMVEEIHSVLKNLKTHFPAYDGKGYEIAGFGWHQGWNDGLKKEWVAEYEENLANLIRDLRDEFSVPNMPAVIAVSGFGGRKQKIDRRLGIIAAQHNVAKMPEFASTVASVETRDFFRPAENSPSRQGYHWNGNAETYFLIGDAMARAMLKLLN